MRTRTHTHTRQHIQQEGIQWQKPTSHLCHMKWCFVFSRVHYQTCARARVCLQGSDPCCLVCFSIKRAVKEREQMAAGPLCPASSHNCHTSCASINLPSAVLQHNFIKTTQERGNNKPAQLSGAKDRTIRPQKNGLGFLRRICKTARVESARLSEHAQEEQADRRGGECSFGSWCSHRLCTFAWA